MNKLTFHNKINPQYREIHVDGAHGGITTRRLINLSFYAERLPIPKSTDITIDEKGKVLKKEASSDSKFGVLREYELGIYMDLGTAKEILEFLKLKIKELEGIQKTSI